MGSSSFFRLRGSPRAKVTRGDRPGVISWGKLGARRPDFGKSFEERKLERARLTRRPSGGEKFAASAEPAGRDRLNFGESTQSTASRDPN